MREQKAIWSISQMGEMRQEEIVEFDERESQATKAQKIQAKDHVDLKGNRTALGHMDIQCDPTLSPLKRGAKMTTK